MDVIIGYLPQRSIKSRCESWYQSGWGRLIMLVVMSLVGPAAASADWMDDVGFTALKNQLGAGIPTGAGVDVVQVEADIDGGGPDRYLPDGSSSEFLGKAITDGTGSNTAVSSHATTVAEFFYGNSSSMAPGVTTITGYEANDYLNNVLDFATPGTPAVQTAKVQSHAWVGADTSSAANANALGRLDFSIDRDGFTAIVGMPNSGATNVLLGNAFNAIAVGVTEGVHVTGPTSVAGYGTGRDKPDLVAPGYTAASPTSAVTSWATGRTASAAALLHEAGAGTDAVQPETMKAILMAGATKHDVNGTWSHTTTDPLDPTFGAGELNVFNSYNILAAGEQEGTNGAAPAAPVSSNGWDYEIAASTTMPRYYNLDLTAGASELSVSLNWNAEISSLNGQGTPTFTFANMDLKIYDSTTTFLGGGTPIDESVSTDHNLEHLYLMNLAPGLYTLEVTSDTARDFGIAWRTIPEPSAFLCLLALGIAAGGWHLFLGKRESGS